MASELRAGATHFSVRNSGGEVWLYDEANREAIRAGNPPEGMGGMPANFDELTKQGLLVGYSLAQDDDLEVAVIVGAPLTAAELATGHWLEPQTAFLRLPSGELCVESNDASRIGFEEPTEEGARVSVPAGDYRLTLHRVDDEALWRTEQQWDGPREVIVLTAGGSSADAATDLLPHAARRDTDWVGKYQVNGRKAQVLVWFGDYWDTFIVNLDKAALERLKIAPGSYLRTTVPPYRLSLVSVFGPSWDVAEKLPPPAGVPPDEYGYAALRQLQDWNGAEGLYCKRATAKTRAERQLHYAWTPGEIEVLDVKPEERKGRKFTATELASKEYFDAEFLTMVLSEVFPDVAEKEELLLAAALEMVDEQMEELGLEPQGDHTWNERIKAQTIETSCRLYAGLDDRFAAVLVRDGSFEIVFLSELDDDKWAATGFADEIERFITTKGPTGLPVPNPRVRFANMDEPLADIFAAHDEALEDVSPKAAPRRPDECVAAFGRFLEVAFG